MITIRIIIIIIIITTIILIIIVIRTVIPHLHTGFSLVFFLLQLRLFLLQFLFFIFAGLIRDQREPKGKQKGEVITTLHSIVLINPLSPFVFFFLTLKLFTYLMNALNVIVQSSLACIRFSTTSSPQSNKRSVAIMGECIAFIFIFILGMDNSNSIRWATYSGKLHLKGFSASVFLFFGVVSLSSLSTVWVLLL